MDQTLTTFVILITEILSFVQRGEVANLLRLVEVMKIIIININFLLFSAAIAVSSTRPQHNRLILQYSPEMGFVDST